MYVKQEEKFTLYYVNIAANTNRVQHWSAPKKCHGIFLFFVSSIAVENVQKGDGRPKIVTTMIHTLPARFCASTMSSLVFLLHRINAIVTFNCDG